MYDRSIPLCEFIAGDEADLKPGGVILVLHLASAMKARELLDPETVDLLSEAWVEYNRPAVVSK